ncbi:hypothetical protein GCM10009527_036800 [Actinomadura nitritigenes]|uniref:DUF2493 domain-containing protein n=1 Tax=Actinomadura nitritigenes TaxID=134602 RepID=A0ABS3QRV4_9ACTN|nr:hypothetical protein [Actinomadura nitritigenes]MBO2436581.1 hypothetical protein [Actinomadura nitritigenes]
MRIAITGHRDLDGPTAALVRREIRALLAPFAGDLCGVSCLAAGADQIFARAVLELGGRLEVIVPARGYAAALGGRARRGFEDLAARASGIRWLDHFAPGPGPYLEAGLAMLDRADRLIAVWDGAPARGRGGTAEIVEHARRRGIAVDVVWPGGAVRARVTGPDAVADRA